MADHMNGQAAVERVVEELLPLYCSRERDAPENIGPELPNKRRVIEAFDLLKTALLPAGVSPEALRPELLQPFLEERLSRAYRLLTVEIARALPFRWRGAYAVWEAERGLARHEPLPGEQILREAARIASRFIGRMPAIREMLVDDIQAAYEGDPAALSFAEVMMTYPGVHAIASHRLAHELYRLEVPIVARIMSEHTHAAIGVDIHPGATIGRHFFIDHATGVVIGETAQVGDRVKLYQGVTLGARSFPVDETGHPQKKIIRHPTVQDNVVIYSNASILGPITIGHNSEIGGNVFLMHDVPPYSKVRQRADVEVVGSAR